MTCNTPPPAITPFRQPESPVMPYWQCGRFRVVLDQPKLMGIVNLTPDSFSDGGRYSGNLKTALAHAARLLDEGAAILDIGGESTRPGAAPVTAAEEWQRVDGLLREVATWGIPISLDTRRTEVMQKALDTGWVDIINDVQALEDPGAVALLAQAHDTGICLMHMQGLPETMQQQPDYTDVGAEVAAYLMERMRVCEAAGIARQRLSVDPGFGFGKTLEHNRALLLQLPALQAQLNAPLLVGLSRKSMLGQITGETHAAERLGASVSAALIAALQGAAILRVHDVKATRQALQVWQSCTPDSWHFFHSLAQESTTP